MTRESNLEYTSTAKLSVTYIRNSGQSTKLSGQHRKVFIPVPGHHDAVWNTVEQLLFACRRCLSILIDGIKGGGAAFLVLFWIGVAQQRRQCDERGRFGMLTAEEETKLGFFFLVVHLGLIRIRQWMHKYIPLALEFDRVFTQGS